MAASISIEAFKDKWKYSELVSLGLGVCGLCFISDSTRRSCVKRNGVFVLASYALCRLSVARENTGLFFFTLL